MCWRRTDRRKRVQIVIKIARGGNPDLQARAVQHLGAFGGAESKQALLDIFKSSTNLTVKRNILRSFMSTGDRDQLLEVARTEPLPELRAEAVQQLGNMGAQEQLAQLYATEKTIEVRRRIIQAMFQRHNPDALVQLLKTETEPELRRSIVQNLGQMGSPQGTAALQSLYASEKDEAVRRAVIDAFANQRNAKVLIELSRKGNGRRDEEAHRRAAVADEIGRSHRLLHGNSEPAMRTAAFVLAGVLAALRASAQQPNFVNARVVARAPQPDVARAIAAITKAQTGPAWIGYAVPALDNDRRAATMAGASAAGWSSSASIRRRTRRCKARFVSSRRQPSWCSCGCRRARFGGCARSLATARSTREACSSTGWATSTARRASSFSRRS